MKTSILFAGAALCLLPVCAPAARAQPTPAAVSGHLTMEDMLGAESLGEAWFSPDGAHLLFGKGRPVASVTERNTHDASISRERFYLADASGGAPRPIGADLAPTHLQPWSPDGRGALALKAEGIRFRLVYWDMASAAAHVLPGLPDTSFPVYDWVAGGRLAYAVDADDGTQTWSSPQILESLDARWRKAWSGDEPQVTVSSANPLFKPSTLAPGALMLAELATGQAKSIGTGDYVIARSSPDGRWLAAVRLDERADNAFAWQARRGELQIFAVTPGGATLAHSLPGLDFDDSAIAWSPAGDRLLIGAKPAGAPRAAAQPYEVQAVSGKVRALATPGLHVMDPNVLSAGATLPMGWIGDRPVAIASRPGAGSPRPPQQGEVLDYGESAGLRYDLYDLSGPAPRNLTAFAKASVTNFLAPAGQDGAMVTVDGALWRVGRGAPRRLSPIGFGQVAGFVTGHHYVPPLNAAYARDAHGERVSLLTVGADGDVQRQVLDIGSGKAISAMPLRAFAAASPDLTDAVARADDRWSTAFSLKGAAGERPLVTINAAMNAKPVAPATRFTYDYKGKTLTGWVVTPPDAKPGVALPAIVSVYGGAVYGAEPPFNARVHTQAAVFSGQLLAAQGYAVIFPSTPLGPAADTDVMGDLAGESIAAVDALAAKGIVDPKRVGVTGQSFGGYSTAAILARRSDRFRAGVALAGIYDWSASYGMPALADMLGQDGSDHMIEVQAIETGQVGLGAPPWKSPEAYARNSPINYVDKLNSPLLLLHGDLDLAETSLAGATRMYNALVRAGKHPALVHYWGEGHVAQSAWAMRDQFARSLAWFDAYVKGGPASSPGG